jgi:hypothetical protein
MNGYYVEWIRGYREWIHLSVESECTQLLRFFMSDLCWFGSRPGKCADSLLQGPWYVGQR